MAVGVVHVLEMVDVEEDKANRLARPETSDPFFLDGLVHVAAVGEARQFVSPGNQVEFPVGLFEFLGALLNFMLKHFPVRIQLRNLALDGVVHDVEVLREDADFVLPVADVDVRSFHVAFRNFDGVLDKAPHREDQLAVQPVRDEENQDELRNEHYPAHEYERRHLFVDFGLGLQRQQAEIVRGVVHVVCKVLIL